MTEPVSEQADKRCPILGVPISVITMDSALDRLDDMTRRVRGSYVCVSDVANLMLAQDNEAHRRVLAGADMITPDGMPLSVVARLRGVKDIRRVCGPDLMARAMAVSRERGWKHFLLGGAEGVPERLRTHFEAACPGVEIVGAYSPPFRPLEPAEDQALIEAIRVSGANMLWVGLGCPKQEKWMAEHVAALPGIVQIGVGAAFNFHSGEVARAPLWMRNSGLEWLHRLASEPRRLWRRYLLLAPRFVLAVTLESLTRAHRRGEHEAAPKPSRPLL